MTVTDPVKEPGAPVVRFLGTRGIPANYGGFETAAEHIALYLQEQGWRVVVYCQETGKGKIRTENWRGIERVVVPVRRDDWLGASHFDLRATLHALRHNDICITFGYNTAILNVAQRLRRTTVIFNMDGIEWARARWGPMRRSILWANERIACWIGNHLIADHPEIERFLTTRARASKITTIAYGSPTIADAPVQPVEDLGLEPGRYFTLICRPILENSILELVTAFSSQRRNAQLVVLGNYRPDEDEYHRAVMGAASDEVLFLGSIYDPDVLASLRFHSLAYMHGHTVGGTNPSLVEALGAGNAVLAHDNVYTRWVAGDGGVYFTDEADADVLITRLIHDSATRQRLATASRRRHADAFTWPFIAGQYETLLREHNS